MSKTNELDGIVPTPCNVCDRDMIRYKSGNERCVRHECYWGMWHP